MRREAEGPGLRTFMLFLPGIWKHPQICHASNKSVIAWLSCCWWCSSSYNTLYYLMRCWLCSCFSQFIYYVVLWKEKVTAAYFPIWKKKKNKQEQISQWKAILLENSPDLEKGLWWQEKIRDAHRAWGGSRLGLPCGQGARRGVTSPPCFCIPTAAGHL